MSVTRSLSGEIAFHCHRANCQQTYPSSGRLGTYPLDFVRAPEERRVFTAPTRSLTFAEQEKLFDDYGLIIETQHRAGIKATLDGELFVIPVRGPINEHRGYMLRGIKEKMSIAYQETDSPWSAWYRTTPGYDHPSTVLVVEDHMSALRVRQWLGYEHKVSPVALMGSHITSDVAMEIYRYQSRVILSLDPDATHRAFQIKQELSWLMPVEVVPIQRDLKDMADGELAKYMKGVV